MQDNLKSKWNTKLLPLLMEQSEVSLYDIVKLVSTEYISGIKYLADFLDYFIYQPDNSLTQEQNNLVLKFIETLINPYNFKEDSSKSIKAFHKFNLKENLNPENYMALHEVYWAKENLNKLFIEQDLSIHQFESCFVFGQNINPAVSIPHFYLQEQFSYFEATCLISGYDDVYELKELFENDKDSFNHLYPSFRECFNILKTAHKTGLLPDETIPREVFQNYLHKKNMHIPGFTTTEYKTNHLHSCLDPSNPDHAPELLLAVNAWEAKYMHNEYPHQEHTPAIINILKNQNITQVNLVKRICAITNPNK